MRHTDLPLTLRRSDDIHNRFVVHPPPGVARQDVLSAGYWVHVRHMLRAGDTVEVKPQDASYYLELWLTDTSLGRPRWRVLRDVDFERQEKQEQPEPVVGPEQPEPVVEQERHRIEWAGPVTKYRILDLATPGHDVVAEGFLNQAEAREAIEVLKAEG